MPSDEKTLPADHALSLYEAGRDEDEIWVQAECLCGLWQEDFTVSKHDQETAPRAAWLEHLNE